MTLQRRISNEQFEAIVTRFGEDFEEGTIRRWVEELGKVLNLNLVYSTALHQKLVQRYHKYMSVLKKKKGGAGRRSYRDLLWEVPITEDDVRTPALQEENQQLREKVSALERKLSLATRTVASSDTENQPIGVKRKLLSEYSTSHARRLKKEAFGACSSSLGWLNELGLVPLSLEIWNTATKKREKFCVERDIEIDDQDLISIALLIKDKRMISDGAYQELAKVFLSLPSLNAVKEKVKELNSHYSIKATPNGTFGVQQSLRERLLLRVEHLLEHSSQDVSFRMSRCIRVKLSGDGTYVGKRIHCVVFSFTLLDEEATVASVLGIHPIAIIREPETYESLQLALSDVIKEVENIQSTGITCGDQTFQVDFYLGGDWKFLAMVTGIDAASSTYACIWCKCSADARWDTSKEWSITDVEKGARSIEENLQMASLPKKKKAFNVSRKPLFPFIPLAKVVIDNLHLFLRVSDVLVDLLIEELLRQDAIDKSKKYARLDTHKHNHIATFEKFVTSIGIPNFNLFLGADSKMKWRSFTGPEKLKLFSNVDVSALLPNKDVSEVDSIQALWLKFLDLHNMLSKSSLQESEISAFEVAAKGWVEHFCEIYQKKRVTPYIHALHSHVGQFLRQHGGIHAFTQQGLEKYNDLLTKTYFRSTNMRSDAALIQILQKANRLEHLSAYEASIRTVKCNNCGQGKHYHLTCLQACQHCSFTPYCAHLVINEADQKIPRCLLTM